MLIFLRLFKRFALPMFNINICDSALTAIIPRVDSYPLPAWAPRRCRASWGRWRLWGCRRSGRMRPSGKRWTHFPPASPCRWRWCRGPWRWRRPRWPPTACPSTPPDAPRSDEWKSARQMNKISFLLNKKVVNQSNWPENCGTRPGALPPSVPFSAAAAGR